MKTCTVTIKSVTPFTASRMHDTPKLEKENHEEYERRVWPEKAHYDANGVAFIPGIAFKQALDSAVKRLTLQIPGKGKATYTKHFLSGVLCAENLSLGIKRNEFSSVTINANADGVRGSGKRVKRTFPIAPQWGGELTFYVLDDAIPKDVFERALTESGRFIGVGQYRPEKGGTNGRYEIVKTSWAEQ